MDTGLLLHILSVLNPATYLDLTNTGLPGGLAVTAVILVTIAVWSLAGARAVRSSRPI